MKKYTIIIEPKKSDRQFERTYNISNEMFFLLTGPLQFWGDEVNEFDQKLLDKIRDSFFDISDVVTNGFIKEKLDIEPQEYFTLDFDMDLYTGEVTHSIKLK